jgi:hypothetical protein
MSMAAVKTICNFVAAIAALVAAYFWFKSTVTQIPHQDKPDLDGTYPEAIVVDGNNFIETALVQVKWSKWAACASAVAALFQGIALLLP